MNSIRIFFILPFLFLGFITAVLADDLIWDGDIERQADYLPFSPLSDDLEQSLSKTPKKDVYHTPIENQLGQHVIRMVKVFDGCQSDTMSNFDVILNEKCVDDFYMSDSEITNAQYNVFLSSTGRTPTATSNLNHPVIGISWQDAVKFSNWLSKEHGKTYSLPSLLQWQHAAKITSFNNICQWASVSGCDYQSSLPVKSLRANDWGLYDMIGNVAEWLSEKDTQIGGSWDTDFTNFDQFKKNTTNDNIGFRLVTID